MFDGASMGCRLHVATHAALAAGPRVQFETNPVVAILVLFPSPLPGLALTTTHMAPRAVQTGDALFDQWFKVQGAPARLLEAADVREALMRVFGGSPHGSGILVDVDPAGVLVRCHEPRPGRTAEVARATLAAAVKLGQRAAFLR